MNKVSYGVSIFDRWNGLVKEADEIETKEEATKVAIEMTQEAFDNAKWDEDCVGFQVLIEEFED